jgi:hypothetical protein
MQLSASRAIQRNRSSLLFQSFLERSKATAMAAEHIFFGAHTMDLRPPISYLSRKLARQGIDSPSRRKDLYAHSMHWMETHDIFDWRFVHRARHGAVALSISIHSLPGVENTPCTSSTCLLKRELMCDNSMALFLRHSAAMPSEHGILPFMLLDWTCNPDHFRGSGERRNEET